jgi:hypothetical protein
LKTTAHRINGVDRQYSGPFNAAAEGHAPRKDLRTLRKQNDDVEIQSQKPGDEGPFGIVIPGEKLLGRNIINYGRWLAHLASSNRTPMN